MHNQPAGALKQLSIRTASRESNKNMRNRRAKVNSPHEFPNRLIITAGIIESCHRTFRPFGGVLIDIKHIMLYMFNIERRVKNNRLLQVPAYSIEEAPNILFITSPQITMLCPEYTQCVYSSRS